MKKSAILGLLVLLLNVSLCHAADPVREFKGSGEVTSVDPVYSQITLRHGAIKGFAHDAVTEFYVSDPAILKNISKGDLVDFDIKDDRGDVKIEKIEKTGVASPQESGLPLSQAVHDTLEGTGQILRGVTSPIPPVSEAVGGAADSTASAVDPRIENGEVKQKIATF